MQPKISLNDTRYVNMYHSNDVCIVRQHGMWYDTNTLLLVTPCKPFALVAICRSPARVGDVAPLYAWLVFRPRALELVFPADVRVETVAVTSEKMQDWYKSEEPWVHVRPVKR